MKSFKCLCCEKKISKNAKWCTSECKKKFILAHFNPRWLEEDREDLVKFLEEYLKIFKNKKEHQLIHKKEPCPKCKLAEQLLRKLK